LEEHVASIFRVKEYATQETSMKQITGSIACYHLHGGFLLGSFFGPEDRGDMFLQKSG
jgi:hypothetical protein